MNFKKTKVAVASGLMAASMVLAPLAAYADFSQEAPELASAKIVKTVKVANGVTIDEDVTFKLTQIHNNKDGNGGVEAPNETVTEDAEGNKTYSFKTINNILTGDERNKVTETGSAGNEYIVKALTKGHRDADTDGENRADDNQYIATTTLDLSEAKVENKLLENGVYTFEIKETEEGLKKADPNGVDVDSRYGWTVNKENDKYILTVYVSTVDGERDVKYSILQDKKGGKKMNSANFTNTFTKRGGSEGDADSLVIKKAVNDTSYYAGQKFEFTISFKGIEGLVEVTEAQAKNANFKNAKKEKITGRNVTKNEDKTYTFELADGESVEFPDIPAGAKYTVTETKRTNTSKTNVSTGNNMPNECSTDRQVIADELITENANQGNFKNYLKDITVTGVVTHSAPFVIMVGALFVAVGGYVILKKRIKE